MSDWENIFGAGVSAESVIDGINRSNQMEERSARRREEKPETGLFASANGRSYEDLRFANFDEALAWEKANPGSDFVRKPDGRGYVMRLFTSPKTGTKR